MPRQTILTSEMIDSITENLRLGTPAETICDYLGISRSAFDGWVRKGNDLNTRLEMNTMAVEQDSGVEPMELTPTELLYSTFADEVAKAKAVPHIYNLGVIRQAARDGTWQASAWYLERTFPKLYGRRSVDKMEQMEREDRDPVMDLPEITEERKQALVLRLVEQLPQAPEAQAG